MAPCVCDICSEGLVGASVTTNIVVSSSSWRYCIADLVFLSSTHGLRGSLMQLLYAKKRQGFGM